MDPQFTLNEIGERFGMVQAQLYAHIITLEKQLDRLMANEAALLQRIDDLQKQLTSARMGNGLSPEAAEIAARGQEVIGR